jgi:hypothetical protein
MCQAAEDTSKLDQDMTEDLTPALLAAQMFVISQKYLIQGLADQSLDRFKREFGPRREPHLSVSDLIAILTFSTMVLQTIKMGFASGLSGEFGQ